MRRPFHAHDGRVTQASAPGPTSLVEILETVGREIAQLGRLAHDLQTTLSPLNETGRLDHQAVESFQGLDLLTQHLHGIADFLAALAPTLPSDWLGGAASAARVVTLSDLARRLSCSSPVANPANDPEVGALELFGADDE